MVERFTQTNIEANPSGFYTLVFFQITRKHKAFEESIRNPTQTSSIQDHSYDERDQDMQTTAAGGSINDPPTIRHSEMNGDSLSVEFHANPSSSINIHTESKGPVTFSNEDCKESRENLPDHVAGRSNSLTVGEDSKKAPKLYKRRASGRLRFENPDAPVEIGDVELTEISNHGVLKYPQSEGLDNEGFEGDEVLASDTETIQL